MNNAFKFGFEKTALTKMIKLIRSGKLSTRSAGRAVKKLKLKPREIEPVGYGAESIVHKVTHPKTGTAVQKTFNKNSPYYNKGSVDEKIQKMKDLDKHKGFAKYLGRKKGKPVLYQEYVKPTKNGAKKEMKTEHRSNLKGLESTKRAIDKHKLTDVLENSGNSIDTRKGSKVIDFLTRKNLTQHDKAVKHSDKASELFFKNKATVKQMKKEKKDWASINSHFKNKAGVKANKATRDTAEKHRIGRASLSFKQSKEGKKNMRRALEFGHKVEKSSEEFSKDIPGIMRNSHRNKPRNFKDFVHTQKSMAKDK